MNITLGRARKFFISAAAKESALMGGATIDSLIRVSSPPGDDPPEIVDDSELVGGNQELQSDQIVGGSYANPVAQSMLKPHTLAFIAAACLGSHSSALTATAAYEHRIEQNDADHTTLETFSVEEKTITGTQRKYHGVAVDSFSITGNRRGFLALESSFIGSGCYEAGTATSAEEDEPALSMKDAVVWLGSGGFTAGGVVVLNTVVQQKKNATNLTGPGAIKAMLETIKVGAANNSDPTFQHTVGSGLYWGRAVRGLPSKDLTLTLLMDSDAYRTALHARTNWALEIMCYNEADIIPGSTYCYGFSLIIPRLRIKMAPPRGGAKDRITVDLTCTVMEDGVNPTMIYTVWNAFAAYLA